MKTNGLVAALEKLKREMTEKLQKDAVDVFFQMY